MKLLNRTLCSSLMLIVFAFLHVDTASAAGRARYIQEGEIKIRFYYDQAFYANQFWNYSTLESNLMDSLNFVGTYSLGLKFVRDNSSYNFLVDMGSQQVWSRTQSKDWMNANLPIETGLVKVLIHFRGMTPDGICYDDIEGSNFSSVDEGITWRALPSGGKASSHLIVTAKAGCSVNSTVAKQQSSIKSTFVHEVGHALAHPGAYSNQAQCKTAPTASIMCHSVKSGLVRSWQRWFSQDITLIRTDVFDTSSKQYPRVSCYEYSSYQVCDNECINTAGFPNPGATEIYENCRRTYCDNMCT